LLKDGKVPVICGGTNYYIESLLWEILVEPGTNTGDSEGESDESDDFVGLSNQEVYQKLVEVDPQRAAEVHWNERRRVLNSLQVFRRQNRRHSELLEEQRSKAAGGDGQQGTGRSFLGGPLRFPANDVAVIWVQCDQSTLDERCDKRVDKMMEEGMLGEMLQFHREFNTQKGHSQYTKGIFQTIGFKEFHDYLLLDDTADPGIRQKLFDEGVEQMKVRTRQYARRQLKWINQRFLNGRARPGELPRVYAVDSSRYPQGWDDDVYAPAVGVVQSYIRGEGGSGVGGMEPLPLNPNAHSYEDTRKVFNCEVCHIQVKGKIQLDAHLKSKRHKHEEKAAKFKSNPDLDMKLVVTFLKGDSSRGERNEGFLNIKSLTGLPMQEVHQLITSALDAVGDNKSCELPVVSNKKNSPQTRDDIDSGKFDNDWLKIRTKTIKPELA